MDRLLSLSQAARMVGVRRRTLQKQIQEGRLSTFEGALRMSELLKLYPDARSDRSGMVEKVRRIQDSAVFKYSRGRMPDAETLAAEVHRLKLALGEARSELSAYRRLTAEFKTRLYDLQDQCDKHQRAMLGTIISWLAQQMKQRR